MTRAELDRRLDEIDRRGVMKRFLPAKRVAEMRDAGLEKRDYRQEP